MFKDKLKELREKAGLSQYELASKLFVSRSAIAKWENGNGIPSDVNLEAICKFFDIDEEWLVDRKDLKNHIKQIDNINKKINTTSIIGIIVSLGLFIFSCLGILQTELKSVNGNATLMPMIVTSIANILEQKIIIFFLVYFLTFSISILNIIKIVKEEYKNKLLYGNIVSIFISLFAYIISYVIASNFVAVQIYR